MLPEKGKQTLPKKSSSKIAKSILEQLDRAENDTLPYSVLYNSGHRRNLMKNEIMRLEDEGNIIIFPKRVQNDLRFVANIKKTGNPSAYTIIKPLIKRYKNAKTMAGKKVVMGAIKETVNTKRIFNSELVDFLVDIIENGEYKNFVNYTIGSLYDIFNYSTNFGIKSISEKFEIMRHNRRLITELKGTMTYDGNKTEMRNAGWYASNILLNLSPEDNLMILSYILAYQTLFVDPDNFSKLVIESMRRSGKDKFGILELCEEIISNEKEGSDRMITAKKIFSEPL